MKELPDNVTAYKRTPVFTLKTIPKALLSSHKTRAETWGKICILKGELLYTIGEHESITLNQEKFGVVEPEILHHIKAIDEVEFYIEFYK